jgi:D-proline reductase (dithiol) PrdB
VGLVQRELEAAGLTTITLSNIPDLTASVSVPRIAAIEYPLGRTLGRPGNAEGQRAVLRATLQALEEMDTPGSIKHLPFEWPEPPRKAHSHPPEPPPIAKYLQRHPWHLPKLLSREVP